MENAIWSKSRGSVTANATAAPDGTTTADLWTEDTSNGTHDIRQGTTTSSGNFYTFSIYAKANGRSVLDVYVGGANKSANFNITTGLVTGGSAPIKKIEDVGGDWYRVSVGCLAASTTTTAIWVLNNGSTQSYTGDGTSGMYFWGAQAEQSLVARDYIETTTAAVYGGITDNTPRLDYTDSSCPALLLEPQRTNALPHSEYIASWSGANTTIVSNAAISPEGVQNASSVTFASGGYWYKSVSLSYTAGQAFTWSIYTTTQDTITRWGGSTPSGTDTLSIEDVGNGWYRQSLTRVVSGSGAANFQPLMDAVFVGVGTTFYVYGAQLEASASYATSYIPTYGNSVSRVQATCLTASPSTSHFGQTEGTIYTEIKINAITSGSYSRVFNLKNSAGSNQIYFQQNDSRINGVVFNGSNQFTQSTSSGFLSVGSTYKMAMAYKNGDYALYVNGTQIGTSTATGLGTLAVDRVDLTTLVGNIPLGNEVKKSLVFKTRLSNEELAALTTI